jgi:DNA-binding LacI/PurR family transcriptional regulator
MRVVFAHETIVGLTMSKDETNKRVTLKDVAEAANVSVMTVSNVVNGRNEFVSERTRAIVQREIEHLNYRAVGSARALRTGKTNSVGVLLIERAGSDPFGSREIDVLFRSFAQRIAEQRFNLVLRTTTPPNVEDSLSEFAQTLDGFCVLSHCESIDAQRIYSAIRPAGKPGVIFGPPVEDANGDAPVAWFDDNSDLAAQELARRLGEFGCQRIAVFESNFVSDPITRRSAAMISEAERRGLQTIRIGSNRRARSGPSLSPDLAAILDPRTCIVALNELQAQSILIELMSAGCQVPDDVQLACLNLTPRTADRSTRPPHSLGITGIRSDATGLGAAAASLLLTHLNFGNFTYRSLTVDCEVVEADTTGLIRIGARGGRKSNRAG